MHISLDSELGQQRRLNQVGETISSISTPATAYSLRSLTGGDPKVVRVRRESDNDEQDFTASEVASGAMLSYVNTQAIKPLDIKELVTGTSDDGRNGNFILADAAYSLRSLGTRQATVTATGDTVARDDGKYVVQVRRNVNGDQKSFTADEVTDGTLVSFVNESFTSSLPLDVQSSAAAYSLRNLSSSYSGNVVEVRRSSDGNTESFTANEVTDGTLLSFVNQIQTVGTAVNGTGSFDNYTVTNLTTTGFSADNSAGGTGSAGFPYAFGANDVIVVRYTVSNFSSTSSLSPSIRGTNATNSVTSLTSGDTPFTANGTYTETLTASSDGTHLMFADTHSGSYTISSFEIVSHSSNGFVKTWYDQSGNDKDAVQTTAANQPKIVSAGNLEKDSSDRPEIDFNGSSQTLDIPTDLITNINAASAFVVASTDTITASQVGLALSKNDPDFRFYVPYIISNNFHIGYADSRQKIGLTPATANTNKHLFEAIAGSTNAQGYLDGTIDGTHGTVSSVSGKTALSSGGIGSINSGSSLWDGQINEIIIYNSDQSTKRRAIEESISGHYGITLGSFNRNGFVRTWYDQSVSDQAGTARGNHAVQTAVSSMPQIVHNGSLVTGEGIDFLGTQSLEFTALNATDLAIFSVIKFDTLSGQQRILGDKADDGEGFGTNNSTTGFFRANSQASPSEPALNVTLSTTGDFLYSANRVSNTLGIFTNGVASATATNSDNFKADSIGSSQNPIEGKVKEVIIYTADQTNNRTAIEANMGSAYGVDLPDGFDPTNDKVNGFVETWYDQFGSNNAVQTVAGSQPRIVNEGSLTKDSNGILEIDFNNKFFDITPITAKSVFALMSANVARTGASNLLAIVGNVTTGGKSYIFISNDQANFNNYAISVDGNAGDQASWYLNGTFQSAAASGNLGNFGDIVSGQTMLQTIIYTISDDPATTVSTIGKLGTDQILDGTFKELVLYSTNQSSSVSALNTNIKNHYGIS